jgi:hypothetical protein
VTEDAFQVIRRWLEDPRTPLEDILIKRHAVARAIELAATDDDRAYAARVLKAFDAEIAARQEVERLFGR